MDVQETRTGVERARGATEPVTDDQHPDPQVMRAAPSRTLIELRCWLFFAGTNGCVPAG